MNEEQQIFMLTVGQLKGIIKEAMKDQRQTSDEETTKEKNYLYGVHDLARFLGVSYPTAHKLKSGILKPAVYQTGRTILFDRDKVVQILKSNK